MTKVDVHPCCRLEAQARPIGFRSRPVLLRNGENKAAMSSSTSKRSASRAGATKASANRSSKALLVLWSSSSTRSRRSKPTLHGARVLDTKSRATSIVWWRVAPGGGACPSCVAVLQRRLRHDASDLPSEQRTRWDQRLQHAARAVRGCEPHQPCSVARQGRWHRPKSRSRGTRKPSDQAGPRESSTERPVEQL